MAKGWTIEHKDNSGAHKFKPLARFSTKGDAESAQRALRAMCRGHFFRLVEPEAEAPPKPRRPAPAPTPVAPAPPVVDDALDPGTLTVAELVAHLETVTDEDEVQRLLTAESEGHDRITALAALDHRIEQLRGAGAGDDEES